MFEIRTNLAGAPSGHFRPPSLATVVTDAMAAIRCDNKNKNHPNGSRETYQRHGEWISTGKKINVTGISCTTENVS
jgi:hypothetical protein